MMSLDVVVSKSSISYWSYRFFESHYHLGDDRESQKIVVPS